MTTINWSGHNWIVKAGTSLGPGPNNWSDSPSDVFIDTQGRLHLRIVYRAGMWYCTEITSIDTLGYGTYTFNISPAVSIDANVVLGMFTYLNDQNEIDIEFSKWGNPNDQNNAGFTVQPLTGGYNQYNTHRFYIPLNYPSNNSFTWNSTNVNFLSKTQTTSNPWSSDVYVPQSSSEKAHINLWLYQGNPPQNGQEQEVIIDSFQFNKSSQLPITTNTAILIASGVVLLYILRK